MFHLKNYLPPTKDPEPALPFACNFIASLAIFLVEFFCIYLFEKMKKLLPLLRLSSKESFKILKKKDYIHNDMIIVISKPFYSHITQKSRSLRELSERLAMMILTPQILEKGNIVEERNDLSIQISYTFSKRQTLSCIIYPQKTTNKYTLISCFKNFE